MELVKFRIGHKPALELPNIKHELLNIITKACYYISPNGQTDAKILAAQTEELYNSLRRYKTLTLPEVNEAFYRGLNNEYGQYFGMCGKTYTQFLRGWHDNPERGKQWNAYLDSLKPKQIEAPKMNIEETKKGLIDLFTYYKEHGRFNSTSEIPIVAASYYEMLKKILNVNTLMTKKQYLEIKSKLDESMIKAIKRERKVSESKGNYQASDDLMTEIMEIQEGKNKNINNMIKKEGLKLYFDSIEKLEL